jgi:SAM-dependent methyltransferase
LRNVAEATILHEDLNLLTIINSPLMKCPVCLNDIFSQSDVLKERLIKEWDLSLNEVAYINKQQGLSCTTCGCNLRSMTLAASIMKQFGFEGAFEHFHKSIYGRRLKALEINEACNLHPYLIKFKKYTFACHPDIDIQNLPYDNDTFDMIVHSDTLEHVRDSLQSLKECYRVLNNKGKVFYTIPVIYGRLSKRRDLLPNSYHGNQDESQGEDYKVWTEYGADFWVELFNAGFKEVTINTIDDLASVAICATKSR